MRAASFVSLFTLALLTACGASEPREADVFHDPALRPGVVQPSGTAEAGLLEQLASNPDPGTIAVGEQSFTLEPVYAAASGRTCRGVQSGEARRVACEANDGWHFVPSVTGSP